MKVTLGGDPYPQGARTCGWDPDAYHTVFLFCLRRRMGFFSV
jgi:hypothetical protein